MDKQTKSFLSGNAQEGLDWVFDARKRVDILVLNEDTSDLGDLAKAALSNLVTLLGWRSGVEARIVELNASRFPNWISIQDRLPNVGERVILAVMHENGDADTALGCLYPDGKWWAQQGLSIFEIPVTHWILLPDPPAPDQQEGEPS